MICLKWSIVRPSPLICSSYCLVFSETIAVLVPRPLATVKRDSKFIHFLIGFKRQEHKVCWCKFEILPPAMASRSKQTPTLFQQFWELFWALPINVHFLFYIKSCLQFSLRCQPIKLWIIFFNKAQLLWCSTHQYIIVQVSFCCSLYYSLFSVSIPNSMPSILRIFPDYTWLWQRQRQIQRQTYFGARHTRAHLSWLCLALCSEPPSNCSTLLFGWADIIHSPPLCLFSTNFSLYDSLVRLSSKVRNWSFNLSADPKENMFSW